MDDTTSTAHPTPYGVAYIGPDGVTITAGGSLERGEAEPITAIEAEPACPKCGAPNDELSLWATDGEDPAADRWSCENCSAHGLIDRARDGSYSLLRLDETAPCIAGEVPEVIVNFDADAGSAREPRPAVTPMDPGTSQVAAVIHHAGSNVLIVAGMSPDGDPYVELTGVNAALEGELPGLYYLRKLA